MMTLIIGRTGSGKTHLAHLLERRGLKRVVSRTTRGPRFEGEDDYRFVTDAEYAAERDRLTETVIDGARYYTTSDDLAGRDFYVIDPVGAKALAEAAPDETFVCVYVTAKSRDDRMRAATGREGGSKETFESRDASENDQFDAFEEQLADESADMSAIDLPENVRHIHVYVNDYEEASAEKEADRIVEYSRSAKRLVGLIREAVSRDIMVDDAEGRILTITNRGEKVFRPAEQVSIRLLSDDGMFCDFMRLMLATSDVFAPLDSLK